MRRAGWGRASSAALLGLCAMAATLEPARAAAETVVSITFDDTNENQWRARALLRAHGMNATFYVNSSRVGVPGFLGLDQLLTLQAEGDEIGSHTLSHANLTLLETAAQRVEVCDDRTALLAMGFAVSSFAYPFGGDDASAKQVLAECGFGSARDISGIRSPSGCFNCPYAETLPPGDPYTVRSTPSVRLSTTLEVLKGYVVQAEQHGGGWVPIVLHHVCDGCNEYAISEATLEAFLAWLEPREAQGTVVRTVAEVMGSGSPPPPPPEPGPNLLKNPSLELDSDGNGTRTADAHSGSSAQRVTISRLDTGDRKLVSAQDSGACAPIARAGHSYRVSAWYKADAPTRLVAYYRAGDGRWVWWAQSPRYPVTGTYAQVIWETPPFPEGATFISVGYSLLAPGSMTVDDLSLSDTAAGPVDVTAPQVALLRPSDGGVVQGQVTFEAQASDETAMGSVDFLVDGRVVGSATSSSGLYAITWDSTSVANGPVAIAALATDAAGNVAVSTSRTVLVANDVAEPGPNLLKNASLELDSDGNGTPDCWQRGGYGTNAFTWTRTADAHSGSWAQRVSVTSLDSGDRKLVSAQDAGACAPFGRAGHTYLATAWYKADAPTRFAAYYRTADGRWVWWAQSERFPATGTYAQVSWETPPFPEGATAISIGYSLLAAGSMTVDDLSLSDTAEVP